MGRVILPLENKPHKVDLMDFPDYEITQEGKVYKKATKGLKYAKERCQIKPYGHHKSNSLRVVLYRNGRKCTRGVVDLMLTAFFPVPKSRVSREVYFLDKDEHNAGISNLKVIDF